MNTTDAFEMARRMREALLDYGPEHSRLLIRLLRTLAQGRPVTGEQVDQVVAELAMVREEAERFLRPISERDAADAIVGIMGLSLEDHPHHFTVNGVNLATWCAADTLFLPALLKQTARVESPSPVSQTNIQLTIRPDRVELVDPATAVLSMVIVNPTAEHMASVTAIWSTFCHHIHFFASRDEAEQWAAGRDDIAILDVHEGFALSQQMCSSVLPYAD